MFFFLTGAGLMKDNNETIRIVIDPGHGGENEGTIENGFQEKTMTLKTALKIYEELSLYDGIEVYMTRTDDRDLSLKERAEFAREVDADFLFSIHYNASVAHDLFGSEVWISVQESYQSSSLRFGMIQLEQMQEMGLFIRGIKTRENDKGNDYYGILREAAALDIPAVIIEHCHVDEYRDSVFCDSEEELEAFGMADAEAIAKYFGLKSETAGVDYSGYMPESQPYAGKLLDMVRKDETIPDVCQITLLSADYDNCTLTLSVSAVDYDSMLLYYDYSIDGGISYSCLYEWPDSNALTGTYTDTFTITLDIPSGETPAVLFRAYNLFQGFEESNRLAFSHVFQYPEPAAEEEQIEDPVKIESPDDQTATLTWAPSRTGDTEENVRILDFLMVCLICVILLFLTVLTMQFARYRSRRKKRRYNRKEPESTRNHTR